MRKLLLVFLIFANLKNVLAQIPDALTLYRVTFPTPNVASLGKYGQTPVGLYTGVPQISIPIYEINSGGVRLPISLSYHAGGIRVEEIASSVGLGWSLNAGGVITRTVMGLDDFGEGPYSHESYINTMTPVKDNVEDDQLPISDPDGWRQYFGEIAEGLRDGEPDIFYYNFAGISGKFFYNQETGQFISNSANKLQIYAGSSGFSIIDNSGNEYEFSAVDDTWREGILPMTNNTQTATYITKTAWHLTRITTRNGKNIFFGYQTRTGSYYSGFNSTEDKPNSSPAVCSYTSGAWNMVNIANNGTFHELTGISFDNGSVQFVYSTADRQDLSPQKALNEIWIKDENANLVKKFVLAYDYFLSPSNCISVPVTQTTYDKGKKRLKLLSILEIGKDGTSSSPYTFEYYTDYTLPCHFSAAQDKWGYYNGKDQNTTLLTKDYSFQTYVPSADREVYANYARAFSLKKIIYPTKGTTEFEYENNTFGYPSSTVIELAGGLRVKKITDYDGIDHNRDIIRTYNYNNSQGGSNGRIGSYPVFNYSITRICQSSGVYASMEFIKRKSYSSFPVIYTQSSPVGYAQVEVFHGLNSEGGMESHKFLTYDDYPDNNAYREVNLGYLHPVYENYDFKRGKPVEESYFKKELSGSFNLVKQNIYEYESLFGSNAPYSVGVKVHWYQPALSMFVEFPGHDPFVNTSGGGYGDPLQVSWAAYKIVSDLFYLKKKKEISRDLVNNLNNEIIYEYEINTLNYQPKKISRIYNEASGESVFTRIKYPVDYTVFYNSELFSQQIENLVLRNLINEPIEKTTYRKQNNQSSEKVLRSELLTYDVNNGLLEKVEVTEAQGLIPDFIVSSNNSSGLIKDSRYKNKFQYLYDNTTLNLKEAKKDLDISYAYLWDYNNSLPIAEVSNANSSEIAYTSFESNGKGNWNYTGNSHPESGTPTGNKAYSLSGFSVTKGGLNSSQTYIVTYWSRSGAQSVNGSNYMTGRTFGSWTLYEHKVVNPAGGMITVSGNGIIDELRLFPVNSLMSTTAYDPVFGITSQCDVNNRIKYYKYDEFGRLMQIRDQDNNILKVYCYNFSGQPETCSGTIYMNAVQSNNFTRNNCPSGYTGSTVTYTVSAGTYFSTVSQTDADQQAWNDILANGQNYANTFGTCTQQSSCSPSNCFGEGYKCVYGNCELGIKVYTSSTQLGPHWWECIYHYEWSDGSWSDDYVEDSPYACPL